MALTFTGSDLLIVIGAAFAGVATVVGAYMGARHKTRGNDDETDTVTEMRDYVDKTFVPLVLYQHETQLMHDARSNLRQELQRAQSNQAKVFREDLRELRQRVDDWIDRTRSDA